MNASDFCDICWVAYLAVSVFSLYSFALFALWWRKKGKATAPYKYFTFLLLGVGVTNLFNLYARHMFLHHPERMVDVLSHTLIWKLRTAPLLIVLIFISAYFTYRRFFKKTINAD